MWVVRWVKSGVTRVGLRAGVTRDYCRRRRRTSVLNRSAFRSYLLEYCHQRFKLLVSFVEWEFCILCYTSPRLAAYVAHFRVLIAHDAVLCNFVGKCIYARHQICHREATKRSVEMKRRRYLRGYYLSLSLLFIKHRLMNMQSISIIFMLVKRA